MTVTSDQMVKSLIKPDEARAILATTEPLSVLDLESAYSAEVYMPGWTPGNVMTAADNTPLQNVTLRFDGTEVAMSKECVFELASAIGLNRAWAKRVPGDILAHDLNYGLKNMMPKGARVLAHNDNALAIVEGTVVPYSNIRLLDTVLAEARKVYGVTDSDLYLDKRLSHDLRSTHMRIVVPEHVRQINSTRNGDRVDDDWSTGIQIRNSLTGENPTTIEGYLFAWWCTNGCATTYFEGKPWSRRGGSTEDITMIWARSVIEEVLGGLEHLMDDVAALTQQSLVGETADVLHDIFARFNVGPVLRKLINDRMADNDDLTMYGLMQAVTSAANDPTVTPSQRLQLTAIGGAIPYQYHEPHTVIELPNLLDKIGETSITIEGVEYTGTSKRVRS